MNEVLLAIAIVCHQGAAATASVVETQKKCAAELLDCYAFDGKPERDYKSGLNKLSNCLKLVKK
jgi:hypothetical protein